MDIDRPASPALPLAPAEYSAGAQNQLTSVLRLFFNRLTGTLNALLSRDNGSGIGGGAALYFPRGQIYARTTQSVSVINTPTRVVFDTAYSMNGMTFVTGDGIHVQVGGVFNVQFSVQLTNADSQIHDVDVWLRKNGVDFADSASVTSVPNSHGGQPGYMVMAANFLIELAAGDYIEFWWSSNSTQVQMNYLPAITTPFTSPGAPAFVVTMTFVSNI